MSEVRLHSKCIEPRRISSLSSVIVRANVVLKKNSVGVSDCMTFRQPER